MLNKTYAKILRDHGREALRAVWRDRNRRYRAKRKAEQGLEYQRADGKCRECQSLVPGFRRYCDSCRLERNRERDRVRHLDRDKTKRNARDRARRPMKPCASCAVLFKATSKPGGHRDYCSVACSAIGARVAELRRNATSNIGKVCKVRISSCVECGSLFTQHGTLKKLCSRECRLQYRSTQQREEYRRKPYTAIKYWRVNESPEALALAETYFRLRTELRSRRHRGSNQGSQSRPSVLAR